MQIPMLWCESAQRARYHGRTGANAAWVAAPGTANDGSITHQRHGTAPVRIEREAKNEASQAAEYNSKAIKQPEHPTEQGIEPSHHNISANPPSSQAAPRRLAHPGPQKPGRHHHSSLTPTDTPPAPPPFPGGAALPLLPSSSAIHPSNPGRLATSPPPLRQTTLRAHHRQLFPPFTHLLGLVLLVAARRFQRRPNRLFSAIPRLDNPIRVQSQLCPVVQVGRWPKPPPPGPRFRTCRAVRPQRPAYAFGCLAGFAVVHGASADATVNPRTARVCRILRYHSSRTL
ncbi:hypothetical protein AK830_g6915 [Neonectria ditissima]|uniref:Uncharacterized protein n=1 Tax=Neonectria ditissima TaxID=78410 RepID=A0A0P7BF84_9HYPO|nr:hypothetical protein AK830_g6915 [Neonectria ditissima]